MGRGLLGEGGALLRCKAGDRRRGVWGLREVWGLWVPRVGAVEGVGVPGIAWSRAQGSWLGGELRLCWGQRAWKSRYNLGRSESVGNEVFWGNLRTLAVGGAGLQ